MKDDDKLGEWEVVSGPGGWMVGWFVCKNCGWKSGEDEDTCPGCGTRMKKVRWC